QLQRFQNEVRAAASLQHPHIVAVHAVGCERGVHYYAMQFIDGYSLEAVVRELRAGVKYGSGAISPSPLYSGETGWGEGADMPSGESASQAEDSPALSPSPLYSGERGWGEGAKTPAPSSACGIDKISAAPFESPEPPHATPPHPRPLSPEY